VPTSANDLENIFSYGEKHTSMTLRTRERDSKTSEGILRLFSDMKRASSFDRHFLTVAVSVAAMAIFDLWAFLKFSPR